MQMSLCRADSYFFCGKRPVQAECATSENEVCTLSDACRGGKSTDQWDYWGGVRKGSCVTWRWISLWNADTYTRSISSPETRFLKLVWLSPEDCNKAMRRIATFSDLRKLCFIPILKLREFRVSWWNCQTLLPSYVHTHGWKVTTSRISHCPSV